MKNKESTKSFFPLRKAISVILAVIMAFSALPVVAAAVEDGRQNTESTATAPAQEEKQAEEPAEAPAQDGEDEFAGLTDEEILEKLSQRHYTVKLEDAEMGFDLDGEGNVVVDDTDEATRFFAALEDSSFADAIVGEGAPDDDGAAGGDGYSFDERYAKDGYLLTLLEFVINHSRREKIYDKYSKSYVYGAQDIINGTYADNGYDFICDKCGKCLDGCVDGDVFTYDETTDPEGIHKKSIEIEIYNEETGETETQIQYYYESEYRNTDEYCDNCGKPMCTYHVFSTGVCDNCNRCLDTHTDENADSVCDVCSVCLGEHTDGDADGVCDVCNTIVICPHDGDITEGVCDICGWCDLTKHYDGDANSFCDRCGKCCGDHTDADESGDGVGFCDVCGACTGEHSDIDADGVCDACGKAVSLCVHPDSNADGICDKCGNCASGKHTNTDMDIYCDDCGKMLQPCSDHKEDYRGVCDICGAEYCEVPTAIEVTQTAEWFRAAVDYISSNVDKFVAGSSENVTSLGARLMGYKIHKDVLLDRELTYTGLPEVKRFLESMDVAWNAHMETAEELLTMSAADIVANRLDTALTNTVSGLQTVLNSVKTEAAKATFDADANSTFTKSLKAYYNNYYSAKAPGGVNETVNKLAAKGREVLLTQVNNLYGSNYKNGIGFITRENRFEKKEAADALNFELYNLLYGNDNAILRTDDITKFIKKEVGGIVEELWKADDSDGNFQKLDTNEKIITGFTMCDNVNDRINNLVAYSFVNYYDDKKEYNTIPKTFDDAGNELYYAVRGKMDNDLARENPGDEYYITDETITKMVRELDNFITSDQVLEILGIEEYGSLYEYVKATVDNMLSDGEALNGVINNILAGVFPMICNMLDGGLDTTINELMQKYLKGVGDMSSKNGVITADLADVISFLLTEVADLNGTLSKVISNLGVGFYGQNIEIDYNGGKGTEKLRNLLHNELGISIYPSEIGNAIASFDKEGTFKAITDELIKAGDDWSKVKTDKFDWKIEDLKTFKRAVSALLSPFSKIINFMFDTPGNEKLELNLTKLARANFQIILFCIHPLMLDLPLSLEIKTKEFNLYGQLIVPLFEALGVNQDVEGATRKLSHKMPAKLGDNGIEGIVDELVDAVFALIEQIAANPVEKLLNMIPNIMFYIQQGFIPELLNISLTFERFTLQFYESPSAGSIIGTILPSIAIIAAEVFLLPALAVLFIPIVGKILYAAALLATAAVIATWCALETVLALGLNISDWANSNIRIGDILSGMVSKKNLGFNINDLGDILRYVLGDSPLVNIVNLVDFTEMGYLGDLVKMSGSARDARTSKKYCITSPGAFPPIKELLGAGEYYYVKADLGDVVWFMVDTVVKILTDKDAFGALLDMAGMKLEDVQAMVDAMNLEQYGLDISVEDIITGLETEDLLFALSELIVPSDKYDLKQLDWAETDSETKAEIDAHDGEIPYLEYDNIWDKDLATALTTDLSGSLDSILEMANGAVDLKATLGIEDTSSLGAIVGGLVDKYVDPSMVTQIAGVLSGLKDTLGDNAALVGKLTRLDLTQWENDFGYLFNGGDAPETKLLPLLTGEKNGDGIVWTYNGKKVETAEDVINAICYLLKPVEKVLDFIFCGKDLGVLAYDKAGGVSGEVITIKGSESYNSAIIPFLEALGIAAEKIPTQAEFNLMGSSAGFAVMINLILDRVVEIANDPDVITDILELFTQLLYMFSSGGLDVLISDLLHPVFVLIDIIRPVFDLDVDNVINTLLCKYTYTIGGYESEEEMRQVMKDRNCDFRIEKLTPKTLFDTVSVVASVKVDGERLFLDVSKVLNTAFNDLAYLRTGYTSKSVDSDGNPVTGYKLSTDGGDCLTVLISFIMEILMDGDTARIIDGLIGKPGLADTVVDFLWGLAVEYSNDFNWAYILGEDATAEQKAALLEQIKADGSISADSKKTESAKKAFDKYLETYENTRWDKATAEYLEQYLTEMIETALNDVLDEETGNRLADTLFEGASFPKDKDVTLADVLNFLVDGYITDETVDSIVYLVSGILTGDSIGAYKDIIYSIDGVLDIDLSVFEAVDSKKSASGDKVIYLDKDGNETGLTRRVVNAKSDFAGALADILKPFSKLVSWLLLGDDLEFFNTTGALSDREIAGVTESKPRRDDLVCVTGSEGYKYGLIPLLEAIGCKNLLAADSYEKDGVYNTGKFLEDLIGSMISWLLDLIGDGDGPSVIDNLVTMLPNLFYYINSNGLTVSVNNIIAMVSTALDIYSEKSGEDMSLASLIGFPLDNLTFEGIFDIIESIEFDKADGSGEKCSLTFNSFIRELLSTFTIGEIYYNSESVFVNDTYGMRFADDSDRAKMLVILVSFIFDFVEDPANNDAFASLLSPEIAQTITNVFNMEDFRFEMQDFTWKFTEYKESNVLINSLEMSDIFKSDQPYGELWTRKMAAELADNLEQFISDMLYLLGLEIGGVPVRDFRSLVHVLMGSLVFNGDTVNSIAAALGQIKPLLDTYDKDGYIAGFVKELLDIDLHSWDDYAAGGKYANGRDWGFITENLDESAVDKNVTTFENALIELLSPIAPLITWLMCEEDFTLFTEGDGLGNGNPVQLTICGSEAYAYSYVPLLEALNVDGSPKDLASNLRKNNILSPEEYTAKAIEDNDYALYGIIHPLMAKAGDIMDSTVPEILELLPSIVYFINCNGLDTCVKNLIHAGLIVLNAIEPVGRQIESFVYDEQGINLYKTIGFEGIIKDTVYGILGITEQDMVELYRAMGDEYETVDGLEDIDFKFLFALIVAKLNGIMKDSGLNFRFTTIAGDAVKELTCGYVRGFPSLNGRQAYTMVLSKDIDSQCYGDLITIILRLVLKFLSTDNNAEALMQLIQAKAKMSPEGYEIVGSLLKLIVKYMASPNNAQIALTAVYYTVYGVSAGSGTGVEVYDDVNAKWTQVIHKLENLNNPIASEIMKTLISIADETTKDVIDSDGIASKGFFSFFRKIIEWFKHIIEVIKSWF